MRRYYLAYGSNLNKEQMEYRCPGSTPIGTAMLEGYELSFKGSKTGSYLTVDRKEGAKAPVAVWLVDEGDEANLDRYEGYPVFYHKEDMWVKLDGKEELVNAFIYIMRDGAEYGMPSLNYVRTCQIGYEDFGFDEDYLAQALRRSRKETEGGR